MYNNKKHLGVINYTGNKTKLLDNILPLLPTPDSYNKFIDICAGSLAVSMSVDNDSFICNDIENKLVEIYSTLSSRSVNDAITEIDSLIAGFDLGKLPEDKEAYMEFRDAYNENPDPMSLLVLLYHSFSNQIRFNQTKGTFNTPFGRRTFNPSLRNKLKLFFEWLEAHEVQFTSEHYSKVPIEDGDFIYIDPPYLITDATYNCYWSAQEDSKMMAWLDSLPNKWAMSNVFEHKGKSNDALRKWAGRYNIHYITGVEYVSGAHHAKNTDKPTIEVLITNY